jgi:hypothetical protein
MREDSPLERSVRGHREEALRVTFFNKLNANERLVAIGAVIVIISWLVGIVGAYGIGAGTIPLLGAIAVLVIYYLKYSPTQTMTWPMPIPTIVLGISAVSVLLALLGALPVLGLLGLFGLAVIAAIGVLVGSAVMAWGAWQDYQAMPKTTPPSA